MTRHGVFATAVALRGISLIDAISPKISPLPILPMTLFFAVRVTSPSRSKYILSRRSSSRFPFSFSAKMVAPLATGSGLPSEPKNSFAIPGSEIEGFAGASTEGFAGPTGFVKSISLIQSALAPAALTPLAPFSVSPLLNPREYGAAEPTRRLSRKWRCPRRIRVPVRNGHQLLLGHRVEELAREMGRGDRARAGKHDSPGLRPRKSDEPLDRLDR